MKKKLDYQQILRMASKSMVRVKDPRRLLKMIARFIDREISVKHTSILMYEQAKKRYIFVDSKGDKRIPTGLVRLDIENPLIQWFTHREKTPVLSKDFLSCTEICKALSDKKLLADEAGLRKRLTILRRELEVLRAAVCIPGYYKGELLGLLMLGGKKNGRNFTNEELDFFQTLANDAAMAIKMAAYHDDLLERNRELEEKVKLIESLRTKEQEIYYQIILSLAREVDTKDSYTNNHLEQVEILGLRTAEEVGLNLEGRRRDVLIASLRLHDVGKIGVPDGILKKQGRLTKEEWTLMKDHVKKGAEILEPLTDFRDVAKIIMHHHENYDGSGYPDGLKGEEIPMESRIVAVVDAFHAMVSDRCYRKALSFKKALSELRRAAGKQFDPKIVTAFLSAIKKIGLK